MQARNPRILRTIPLVFVVALLCPLAYGKVIHVDDDGHADFDNIQAGIDAANGTDTVLVAPGEYVITEPITFKGKAITVKSEAGRDETTIRMGTPADTNRGSVVVFENNETVESVLDGFTITGGRGSWWPSASNWGGGGIVFDASSGTVRNCAVVENTAKNGGGVFAWSGASPILTNCIISVNSATGVTYGVDGYGGGLFCGMGCLMTLANCTVAENSAGQSGGGLWCWFNSSVTMTDCIIRGNSATGAAGGGVIGYDNSSVTMTNCIIMSNTSQHEGGGIASIHGSATLTNCVIARNTVPSNYGGGGLACAYPDSSMTISNCTIWGNETPGGGGGIVCWQGSATVTNSILSGNTATLGPEISVMSGGTLSLTHSNVAGGQAGASVEGGCTLKWDAGNIDADPLFAEPGYWADVNDPNIIVEPDDPNAMWIDGDYHLKSEVGRWDPYSESWVKDEVTSLCVDAGDPASDWAAELWPHGKRTNMGAFGGTPQASMSLSDVGNAADFNIDGIVNFQDFANLARCWQTEQVLLPEELDRNGTVDLSDLAVFTEHWLGVAAVSDVADFETADFSKFEWEHAGNASWAVTPQQKHSGAYSAKAGSIDHGQSTTLQVSLDCGSGNITFYRKVSSEAGRDTLKFYIDGVERGIWSGEEDWAEVSFGVIEGRRTFKWTYSKSDSGSKGDDTAWIDDIVFPTQLNPTPPTGEIELTDATFDQIVLSSDVPVLVDFWAPWCGPCLTMAPIIEEIADEYAGKAKVCKLNVDNSPNTTMAYGVSAIPTFILFKDGQIQRKWIGTTSKEVLTDAIDELL